MQSFSSFNSPPSRNQQAEKSREIALVLEEWTPADENALYAEEGAVELAAAANETSIIPIPEVQEDLDGRDIIDNLSDCNILQWAIEEDESASSSAEAVDSNVGSNVLHCFELCCIVLNFIELQCFARLAYRDRVRLILSRN